MVRVGRVSFLLAGRDRGPGAEREAGLALVGGPVAGRVGVVGGHA
jgi:hypothetical protein